MDTLRLTQKDLKKLDKYILHEEIENNESTLFIYNKKELLKLFKITNKEYNENKIYILNELIYLKSYINLKELVLPNKIVKVSGVSSGYTMDFINKNTNLSLIMKSPNISLEDKIYFLKKVAKIISKIENDKDIKQVGFYLGDIHEGNFIYDNKNNIIKVVDLDSGYIPNMRAPISKFLTYNDKLWDFPTKYPLDEEDRHIPNSNTTIISLIYIILNMITDEYTPNMTISEFCECLNILKDIGFEKELLDSIYNIYLPKDNYFNYELLNTIEPKLILKYREIKKVKK